MMGDFVVAWESSNQDGSNDGVFGRARSQSHRSRGRRMGAGKPETQPEMAAAGQTCATQRHSGARGGLDVLGDDQERLAGASDRLEHRQRYAGSGAGS